MTMTDPADAARRVTGGVDTHADLYVCAAVCSATHRRLGVASFEVNTAGYQSMLTWLEAFGAVDQVGIEGAGTYGAGLTRFLAAANVEVVEVNRPDRSERRFRGKTDAVDAEAAARAALSGQATGKPKGHDGSVEAIRILKVVYASAMKDRTAAMNQFHALVSTAPESIREELAGVSGDGRHGLVQRWRHREHDSQLEEVTRHGLKELAGRIEFLSGQASRLELELSALTEQAAAPLLDLAGVGVHCAAELLMAVGDNRERITSEAAFAHLCGAAPVPASSGKTNRHRLNYAGNRSANHALWRIVMARMAHRDPRTIAYVERRTAEGLSKRDIIRCLKRYVAREVYRVLMDPPAAAPAGAVLREMREQAGRSQVQVAEMAGLNHMTISRIERGLLRNGDLQRKCHQLLAALQPDA
jgi:transposase